MTGTSPLVLFLTALALQTTRGPWVGVAHAAPRIHVHGTSTFDVRVSRKEGKVFFWGTLRDDAAHPLPKKTLKVSVTEGSPHGTAVPVEWFRGPLVSDPRDAPGSTRVVTEGNGGFSVFVSAAGRATYFAHFEWAGDANVDGATLDTTADPSRRAIELRCDPPPRVVDLDDPIYPLRVTAIIADEDARDALGSIPLVLTDERGAELDHAATSANQADFRVARERFGGPGPGELRVHFAGDAFTSPALLVAPIERRATVVLSLLGAGSAARPGAGAELPAADPEEGAPMAVSVTTTGGAPVATGIVEVLADGLAVGAAPVEKGRAEILATFARDDRAKAADLRIRYVSDTPWYVPGSDVTARLPLRAGRPWRRVVLLFASLGVVLWLALTRRRSPVGEIARPKPDRPAPGGKAGISVVRATKDPRVGWSGQVIDAHEAVPLADVEIRVERPSFTSAEVLARTSTGTGGRFEIRCEAARKGDRLVVSGPLHTRVERDLPAFGEIQVALVLRKRALLDRLVTWAKAAGGAYPGVSRGEPTPAQVARVARDAKVEAWARAVENASFGPDAVDAETEAEVDALAPRR